MGAAAITAALATNVVVFVCLMLCFCVLRSRKENEWFYMARYRSDRWVTPEQRNGWVVPPTLPPGLFGWIMVVINISDETVLESAGLDALTQILFMRMFFHLFAFCTAIGVVVLLPMYAALGTNEVKNADRVKVQPEWIDQISLTNVEAGSNVLWATFLAAIVFTAYACYLVKHVYMQWIVYRHRHLAANAKKGYGLSVLVQYIPEELRTDVALARFYESIFKDKFESCVVARDLAKLIDARAKIDQYEWKLELAETKWEALQGNYSAAEQKVRGKRGEKKRASSSPLGEHLLNDGTGQQAYAESESDIESENHHHRNTGRKMTKRPQHRTRRLHLPVGKKVDSIEWFGSAIERLEKEIEEGMKENFKPLNSGIVTFNSAVAALSCEGILAPQVEPYSMMQRFAPEPQDVYWPNLGINKRQRTIRELLVAAATFWLVIFWLVPVLFVSSLTTLSSLSSRAPWLDPIVHASPVITGFLAGVLPSLALLLFNLLLPKILLEFSRFEGIEAHSWMQLSLFNRFFIFIVVNNFLAVTLGGALMDQLDAFIESPTSILELLGASVPKAATFFTNYIMIMSFVGFPAELLNPFGLLLGTTLKNTVATTEAQKDRAECPSDGGECGVTYSLHIFVVLVAFVFAPIAPIILPFATIYCAIGLLVCKYKALYCIVPTDESGGAFWPAVFAKVRIVFLIAHITLVGIFALKKQVYISPIAIGLPIVSWWYTSSLMNAYNVRGKYLTAQKAAQLDDRVDLDTDPNDLNVGSDAKYRRSLHLADTPTFDDDDAYAAPVLPDGGDMTTTVYGGGQDCTRAGSPKKTRLYPNKALIGGIMATGSAATQAVRSALKRVLTHDVDTVDTDGKVPAPQDAYGKQLDALVFPKPRCRTSGKIASSFKFAARGVLAAARAADEGMAEMAEMAEMEGDSVSGPGASAVTAASVGASGSSATVAAERL